MKIFSALTADMRAVMGASRTFPLSERPEWIEEAQGSVSAPAMCIETKIDGEVDLSGDRLFSKAFLKERKALDLIDGHIAGQNQLWFKFKSSDENYLYAEPEGDKYGSVCVFRSSKKDYLRDFMDEYGWIEEGTTLIIRLKERNDYYVDFSIVGIGEGDERESLKQRRDEGLRFKYFCLQMSAQQGRAVLQVRPGENTISVNKETGYETHMTQVVLKGKVIANLSARVVENTVKLPDGSFRLTVARATQRKNSTLVGYTSMIMLREGLPYLPERRPDTALWKAVGTVASLGVGLSAVKAVFDGGQWASDGFRDSVAQPWSNPGLVARYLALGFPCRFSVDTKPDDPTKSRLFVRGLHWMLQGRILETAKEIKAGKVARGVPLAPCALVGDEIMMVNEDYTAFMNRADAPGLLWEMARSGVFFPDFRLKCDIEVVKPDGQKEFRVKCTPSYVKIEHAQGELIDARIIGACGEFVYLMAGEIPAVCRAADSGEATAILTGEADVEAWRVKFNVKYRMYGVDAVLKPAEEKKESVPPGIGVCSLFRVGDDMTYKGFEVINLPSHKAVEPGTLMLVLNCGSNCGAIVATDDIERFTRPGSGTVSRMRLVEVDHRTALVEELKGEGRGVKSSTMYVFRIANATQGFILRRLLELYGTKATVVVFRDKTPGICQCIWTGIACHHDYSALLGKGGEDVRALWPEADSRVLFGDVTLCRSEIDSLRFDNAVNQNDEPAPAADDGLAEVIAVDNPAHSVIFRYDGGEITLRGTRALRLPFPKNPKFEAMRSDLADIFAHGSRWAVEEDDEGAMRLSSPDGLRAEHFTFIAPFTRREETKWVVRGQSGAIALSSELYGTPMAGTVMYMNMAEDDYSDSDDVVNVCQVAEEDMVGDKLTLVVESVSEEYVVCRDYSGRTTLAVRIPIHLMSWNEGWRPSQLKPGVLLKARVMEVRNDCLVADRRILLPQDALVGDQEKPRPGKIYSMDVVGKEGENYILEQNGFRVPLPIDQSAVFHQTYKLTDYLSPGDSVTVYINNVAAQGEEPRYVADWRTLHQKEIDSLASLSGNGTVYDFTVHHHGVERVYVEREGVILAINNEDLGYWRGRRLEREFPVGDTIAAQVAYDAAHDLIELRPVGMAWKDVVPEPGDVCEGTVSMVYPIGCGCYVAMDGWQAFVPANKMWGARLKLGNELTMAVGDRVSLSVIAVDRDRGQVKGSMKEAGNTASVPEIRTIKGVAKDASDHRIYYDSEDYLIKVVYENGLTAAIVDEAVEDTVCIYVEGLYADGTMKSVPGHAHTRLEALASRLNSLPDEGHAPIVGATVVRLSDTLPGNGRRRVQGRVVVECDGALGWINEDCLEKPYTEYKAGQKLKICVLKMGRYSFSASEKEVRRIYAREELKSFRVGCKLKLADFKECRGGLVGRAGNVEVFVPEGEIPLRPGSTIEDWAAKWNEYYKASLVVTAVEPGRLVASRRAALAEGVVE